MANKSSMASVGALTDVDTTQRNPLGFRVRDEQGNEYIYLVGVASTVANDLVTYNSSTYTTTRLAADAVGPVAIAQAAIVASTWGWYLIWGFGSANSDTTAAGVALYIDGTTGRCDDAVVTGDLILGASSTAQDASNVLPIFVSYPFVTNILG